MSLSPEDYNEIRLIAELWSARADDWRPAARFTDERHNLITESRRQRTPENKWRRIETLRLPADGPL